MKKQNAFFKGLLLSLMLLLSVGASADTFKVGGIRYEYVSESSTTVSVIELGNSKYYSGNIVIPSSVTYNGKTYSVTSIGNYAFWHCTSLTSITLPESVTNIEAQAFFECTSLASITLPQRLVSIGVSAFGRCSALTEITIPESVTNIESSAFMGCSALTEFFVDENNANYSSERGVLYNKQKTALLTAPCAMTSITIPEGVISIGNYAFYGCSALTEITLPQRLTSIGEQAFSGCSVLTSITIPEGVTSIGAMAFIYSSSLTDIYCQNPVPCTLGYGTFYDLYANVTVHVPTGALVAYQADDEWKKFENIVEYDVTAIKNAGGAADDAKVKAVYGLDGKRVAKPKAGNAYIIQYQDGSTKKVLR